MPGELPLVLLALVAERPMGGYELLQELGRRFGDRYRPSPGSVYPALSALKTEALLDQAPGRGDGVYSVNARGKRVLASKRALLAEIEVRTATGLDDGSTLKPVLDRFVTRVSKLNGRVDRAAVERILDRAARSIDALEGGRG